jgi:hypothetical protein
MLYEVDFAIKVLGSFCTVHTAFIQAISVSECQAKAEEIRNTLPQSRNHDVRIFIAA